MKVLITASTAGHIRSFHLPYIDAFQARGWTVHVASGGDGVIGQADRFIKLPFEKSMFSPHNFKAAQLLRKLIRTEKYDLICTHTSLAAFFTRLALKTMKKRPRVVNVVHGYLFDDETGFIKKHLLVLAEKLVADCTDLVLTMNEWDYHFAKENRLAEKVDFIPGIGVNFDRFLQDKAKSKREVRAELGLPEDKFIFIYAAEFSKRKSQKTLIKAMTQLPENAMLILAGTGQFMDACIRLANEFGMKDRILFPGHVGNIGAYYRAADAAVSASRSEGMPFNLLEAVYFGLPIAATRVKGHTDLMKLGFDIRAFDFGDSNAAAAAMSAIMEAEIRDDHAADVYGRYGIEHVLPQVMRAYWQG